MIFSLKSYHLLFIKSQPKTLVLIRDASVLGCAGIPLYLPYTIIKIRHFSTLHVYLALHVYLILTLFPPCTFIRHTRVGNYTISNKEIQNEKWIYKCNTYSFHTCCNIVFRQKLAALTLLFHKKMHQWKVHTDTLAKILECNKVQQNKRGNKHKSDKGLPA